MGERYLITGVQLGMLTELSNKEHRKNVVKDIVDKQFVCNTDNTSVEDDAEKFMNLMKK